MRKKELQRWEKDDANVRGWLPNERPSVRERLSTNAGVGGSSSVTT